MSSLRVQYEDGRCAQHFSPKVGRMLAQRLRSYANIVTTLVNMLSYLLALLFYHVYDWLYVLKRTT